MSIDLAFWKCRDGVALDPAQVYAAACCEHAEVEGLEALPVDEILTEIAAAFPEWTPLGTLDYEREGRGSFQVSATAQSVRFGSGWTSRPCTCRTAQLTDPDTSRRLLGELLQRSIGRAVEDLLARTCYA